jgi:uncharacterized protein YgiM (DUF1202 family)
VLTGATKTRAVGLLLAVALTFVLQVPQPAAAAEPTAKTVAAGLVRTTTAAVNLRKGPGTTYKVSTVLPKGSLVTTAGKSSNGYARVIRGALTGWVASRYLAKTSGVLPRVIGTKVATTALDIRTSSGADSRTLSEVKKGTVLSVPGASQSGRAQIVYRKAARWVTAKYLANPVSNLPKPPALPKVTGTRYATAALNIRSTYQDKYTLIGEVPRGTKLSITGVVKNKRMQIIYLNAARWVTAQYLSTKKPTAGGGRNPYAMEKGLKPNAIKVHRAILAAFPEITTFYGVRADPLPDHPSGRAIDCMIPSYKSAAGKALGHKLSRWARTNAKKLGINYVIWDQHIWNNQRAGDGWRYMASRGSDTANHKNHVHITVYAAGYRPI